jgi:WD40 repeat protein
VIIGTAAYMAPEQARGAAADRRSDIWSFGVVLYEMLTGRRMFTGETVSDTLAAVLKTDPDWSALPAETPPAIRRLLRRCLERDRRRRLADIADARLEIEEALAAPPEAPPRGAPAGFRWWNAVAGILALGGVIVAVFQFRETPPQAAPVRFEIPPQEKGRFGNYGMALSPDGRRLAFIATGADGRPMLWVRSLDSVAAQALPGTEGAEYLPFWSPDSRFIGFGVAGTLKKVEASGGPVQVLAENTFPIVGGSWNREGAIIFGPATGGLLRAPQSGGMATKLTAPVVSPGELGQLRPWFLPDGRHFLYFNRGRALDNEIYVGSLDSQERKRLVASQQAGVYAPPAAGSEQGHLLFLRDGTLMAQPLDATRFELAGDAFPVAEHVGSSLAMGFFSVSANGVLAYRSGGPGFGSRLTWFDRDGKSLGTLGPLANYARGLALSPDGKRVALGQTDQTGNLDVWVLDVARGVATRFTFDPGQDSGPVWSPDGQRLAFGSGRSGTVDIYQKDFDGRNERLMLRSGAPTDWSPDGRTLLI